MAHYAIRTDLLKLPGAFVTNLQGKTAVKQCVCIPIEDAGLFLGKQGCYLNMTAIEMQSPKFQDTHCIKQDLPKEKREAMTEEQRRAMPILGGLHALERRGEQMPVFGTTQTAPGEDDLPF